MDPQGERAGLRVRSFEEAGREAFDRVHCDARGTGWCHCVAWWTPTWDGWGERTAAENRALRDALCARGELDGYLLFDGTEPVGWCQAGPRDRLAKLVEQLHLEPDPATWALTCFLVAPERRGERLATRLLAGVLDALRARGVARVEACPKRGADLDALDLWTGPEAMFRGAGFRVVRDDPARPVLALELDPD